MTTFYTFETINRHHTVKADNEKEAKRLAIACILSRLVKDAPFMTGETLEALQTGLETEFANARVRVFNN